MEEFAARASLLRFKRPDTPDALTGIQRFEDAGTDLWTVFSRIQENIIKGYSSPEGKRKVMGIRSIDRNVEINTKLWDIAAEYIR